VPTVTPSGKPVLGTHLTHSTHQTLSLVACGPIVHSTVASMARLLHRDGIALIPDRRSAADARLLCRRVGNSSTWRIVKASWRYLASLRLAGDPGAPGGPLGGCCGCADSAPSARFSWRLADYAGSPGGCFLQARADRAGCLSVRGSGCPSASPPCCDTSSGGRSLTSTRFVAPHGLRGLRL
jgi:hypothetical protein